MILFLFSPQETTRKLWRRIRTFTASSQKTLNVIHPVCCLNTSRTQSAENVKKTSLSRPAFPGQAVHRHGTEGSPGIRHQAEEGGEDEGDQRTGLSL